MKAVRTRASLAIFAVALLAVGCGKEGDGVQVDAGRVVARGRAYAQELIGRERGAEPLSAGDVVALGYLERLRLGLGSPFRLIDQALNDPRLDDATRRSTAQALLARTLDGHAYNVDPADGVKRIKVCRVDTVCKMTFKEGQTPRTRVRNLVAPLRYEDLPIDPHPFP